MQDSLIHAHFSVAISYSHLAINNEVGGVSNIKTKKIILSRDFVEMLVISKEQETLAENKRTHKAYIGAYRPLQCVHILRHTEYLQIAYRIDIEQ